MSPHTIIPERLAQLADIPLASGGHSSPEEGMCILEAVSWVAGEPWSDHPKCASSVIGAFLRTWNDQLPDEDRTRLLAPYIERLVGSAGTPEVEECRSYLAFDWLIRVHAPAWLRLAKLEAEAVRLEGLAEIQDAGSAVTAGPVVREVREVARAARAAAGVAAGDAAWAAAGAAVRAAAGDAVWAAAGDAVWDAAGDAAGDALRPTVEHLQTTTFQLLDRMLALTEDEVRDDRR